ncbi:MULTISPECIES: DUF6705 family protein [Flavobacterium]|uniref:DUF6705 family protein n=1 Tax=Flavobacterium TaxID=237 RepID=UPI00086A504B|nr:MULTISPECIES: DUF6705 family protein [Flavobacterium]MBN9284338.1 hypothetical protein [Flavobacterium sp.]ODS85732.1 MAG: hypothetical protein ABS44_14690 [Chryseobacterium sp. SCN 40-13]OJV72965.1 MAG: hypothetical protein BGO42_00555 [Flavobacterium sp. 40-81]
MKKTLVIIVLLINTIVSYSQNQYPLYLSSDAITGGYYKDIDNDLNKFQGTWKYSDGTTSLTIVLKKKNQVTVPYGDYMTDILVGEYSFVYNGTQQTNTLNSLEQNATTYGANNIYATIIRRCDECLPGQRKVVIGIFKDPVVEYLGARMSLSYYTENGTEKLKLGLKPETYVYTDELPPIPAGYESVPIGKYILTKQP